MRRTTAALAATIIMLAFGCSAAEAAPGGDASGGDDSGKGVPASIYARPLVTFVELDSVNCVPCRAMQPVMDEIKARFPGKVEVLFYDVWTKEGQPYGRHFGIRLIPTQVFLDKDGKEYYRHEGFLALEEVLKALERGGVKP